MLYTILSIIATGCVLAFLVMYFGKPLLALPHKELWVIGLLVVAFVIYMVYLMLPITHIGDVHKRGQPNKISKSMMVKQQFEQY